MFDLIQPARVFTAAGTATAFLPPSFHTPSWITAERNGWIGAPDDLAWMAETPPACAGRPTLNLACAAAAHGGFLSCAEAASGLAGGRAGVPWAAGRGRRAA